MALSPLRPVGDHFRMTLKHRRAHERTVRIHWNGHEYITAASMGEIFLGRVRQLITTGRTELVPLLHDGGLEMLLVSPSTAQAAHRRQAPLAA